MQPDNDLIQHCKLIMLLYTVQHQLNDADAMPRLKLNAVLLIRPSSPEPHADQISL